MALWPLFCDDREASASDLCLLIWTAIFDAGSDNMHAGPPSQFTCFTGTKGQTLTSVVMYQLDSDLPDKYVYVCARKIRVCDASYKITNTDIHKYVSVLSVSLCFSHSRSFSLSLSLSLYSTETDEAREAIGLCRVRYIFVLHLAKITSDEGLYLA